MKKLIMALMGAASVFAAGGAQAAGSQSGTFNVNITLTPTCTMSSITAVDFAYTSLQPGIQNSTAGGFSVTCTNSLPYTFGLQTGSGAATPPGSASITVTDDAVNLTYQLNAPAAGVGSGSAQSLNVAGTMAASQSGTCAAGPTCSNTAATNKTQTLIVNY